MYYFLSTTRTIAVFLTLSKVFILLSPAYAETISLSVALQRTLEAHPRLDLNLLRAQGAQGQIDQANVSPNPVISADLENLLGTGPIHGVQSLEITLGIRQLIETADKRHRRVALAQAMRDLVDWDRDTILAEIEESVRLAYIDILLAQENFQLREEQLALSKKSVEETALLFEAARVSDIELTRAQLAVSQQQFILQRAGRELVIAKSKLASQWGEESQVEFTVIGEVVLEPDIPKFSALLSMLDSTVTLARYNTEEEVRESALDLERARATPDFEAFVGTRYLNEDDGDVGFVVGIEVPWPLFDNNQGNIHTARAQLRAVRHERASARRELLIALDAAYQQLLSAHEEANALQNDLLPSAEATLRDAEEGYQRGQFNQLAVLESRNTVFGIREAYLDSLRRYAVAQAKISALTRPTLRKM
jgi:cobalt-zinc-cadmium efflux system outer membrane protein